MQSAVYSAVFGGLTQSNRLNLIANNLANVNTTGYKKDNMSFINVFQEQASDYVNPNQTLEENQPWPQPVNVSQTRIGTVDIDYSQGHMRKTDNPLDFAIDGQGFFKVSTPDGMMYSRNGIFHLSQDGGVVDQNGNALQSDQGDLRIPQGGDLIVDDQGRVMVDGNTVGNMKLVTFEDPQRLERIGQHLFRNPKEDPMEEKPLENASLQQGFLEGSNVQVIEEMVRMIEVTRTYNAGQKVMTTSTDMDKKVTDSVGKA